jgi:hypothetical protein
MRVFTRRSGLGLASSSSANQRLGEALFLFLSHILAVSVHPQNNRHVLSQWRVLAAAGGVPQKSPFDERRPAPSSRN